MLPGIVILVWPAHGMHCRVPLAVGVSVKFSKSPMPMHDGKLAAAMLVTLSGIVTLVKLFVSRNALGSMLVIELGMLIETKPVFWKVYSPMVVMESGKVTFDKLSQFWKVPVPVVVRPLDNVAETRLSQSLKTSLPMLVIEFGMVTDVRPDC